MTVVVAASKDLSYSRVVSDVLLAALRGPLSDVVAWRDADLGLRDVQLRREPKGRRSWASLYLGLTSVLDIDERDGAFRLRTHKTHATRACFEAGWTSWRTLPELVTVWPDVQAYLARIVHLVDRRWTDVEGRVHALLGNGSQTGISVVDREASLAFRDRLTKSALVESWAAPLRQALLQIDQGAAWSAPLRSTPYGTSPDFLALDDQGRLLVIEAKPAGATAGIVRGPAQVRLYASMYAHWLSTDAGAVSVLEAELAQRQAIGLLPSDARTTVSQPLTLVPVLAVGPGMTSPEAWGRLRDVRTAVDTATRQLPPTAPLEVWRLSRLGPPEVLRDEIRADPAPRDEDIAVSTYAERARAQAVSWKLDSVPQAVEDGPYPPTPGAANRYPFCLPLHLASHNLLPAAAQTPAFFAAREIQWHTGVSGGPTNHLVSSQVQCVNALFPMTGDPALILRAFADVLPIAEVLPVEGDAYLTFEYVGCQDHLNEGPNLSRGAHRTSADAAVRYRTPDGEIEMALIEWKYTEQYRGTVLSPDKHNTREQRYRAFWDDLRGPLRGADGPLAYADLFVEPFYQLMRQQFLAWRMELAREHGASKVRVVHVAPSGNTSYQQSLRPVHREIGDTVGEVWRELLRRPDRFVSVDSDRFLDEDLHLTNADYRDRYGHR